MSEDIRNIIVIFLRKLALDIENNNVSDVIFKDVSEFYMKFLFLRYVKETESVDRDNLMKYFSMGWYVYTMLN